jgi:hypothetical protein
VTSPQPFHWREASLCVPAIPLLLVLGFFTGESILGAIAAGAAFSVGFGAARELRGRRWGAMVVAAIGMSIAAFLGSVAGGVFPAQLLLAGVAAAACAALALYDENLWWISLQLVIALLVAGYYPGSVTAGLHRAAAVLIGGTIQILVVVALANLIPAASGPLPSSVANAMPDRRLLVSHVVRAAICVIVALILARTIGLVNGYWAPMTAMLILKPGLHETRTRGLARLSGTIAGCLAATAFAQVVDFSRPLLLVGLTLTAGLAYALQKAHYAILTCAITATVVLLVSLGSSAVVVNAEHRLVATLIGGIVALVIAHIAPHRLATGERRADHVGA